MLSRLCLRNDGAYPKCIRWDFLSSNLKYKTWHEKIPIKEDIETSHIGLLEILYQSDYFFIDAQYY